MLQGKGCLLCLALRSHYSSPGIGYGQIICSWYVATYYSFLMGLTIFYLGMSFSDILPWSVCDDQWADENCVNSTSYNPGHKNNSQSSSEQYF